MKKLSLVIVTPLLLPQIGGGALYADVFRTQWTKLGHDVKVVPFGALLKFPSGLRHFLYLCKLLPHIISADAVYALDTFSVALPTVFLCRLLKKKVIVRVGGDFLWETYVNRTREKILLSEFYSRRNVSDLQKSSFVSPNRGVKKGLVTLPNEERKFTFKENTIFDLTNFIFQHASTIVFSTQWQKDICMSGYNLDIHKVKVIENIYIQNTKRNIVPKNRVILSPSRNIFLKNKVGLSQAFSLVKDRFFDAELDTEISDREELLKRINDAYMVVVPSLSEVSPNIVLDALSLGVPTVVTSDCGMKERLGDLVVWVDPKRHEDIARGIESLMDSKVYSEYMARISKFSYTHSEEDCAQSFLNLNL